MTTGSALTRRQAVAAMAAPMVVGATGAWAADAPLAQTAAGKVRGVSAPGVLSFRGIPYAGNADGAGRFRPPRPVQPWNDVRDAGRAGMHAVQTGGPIFVSPVLGAYFSGGRTDVRDIVSFSTCENCQVLNVLTPSLRGRRPVMVYIHGGGFTGGSGDLTLLSDRFVREEDIVLVGINHRLNIFGYTYLPELGPDYADSGNVGQLDLIAALQWVRDNAADFGGDPANVTIFGESGGGAKISALLATPAARGLFHRAIVESGSALSVRTPEAARQGAADLLKALNTTDARALLTMSVDKLMPALNAGAAAPVVDGRSLPHQTWQGGAPAEAAGVDLLVGNCKDEASYFQRSDEAVFHLDWAGLRTRQIQGGIPENAAEAIIAQYRKDYPADSASDIYFRIASDRSARRNATSQAQAKAAQGKGTVYMYNFAWNTGLLDGKLRAFHTSELPLAMRLVLNPDAEGLSRQIAGAWANFSRNGNPNHAGLPRWNAYDAASQATMVFDAGKTRQQEHPAAAEMALLKPYPTGRML